MEGAARAPLVAWESFYVIVGSSGAALTGLQFVVMALVADSQKPATSREIDTFGTPTIVHFCAVLLISAILSAPWQGLSSVRLVLSTCALIGVIYGIIIVRRAGSNGLQTGLGRLALARHPANVCLYATISLFASHSLISATNVVWDCHSHTPFAIRRNSQRLGYSDLCGGGITQGGFGDKTLRRIRSG